MNQTIRELFERKSVRVYEDREISPQDKELILKAAFMAPTAGGQQLYTIIDVTNKEVKEKLAESCDHQPFIATGKLVLVFLADCQKWYDVYQAMDCDPRKPGAGDFLIAVNDALIAAQNAVVAAQSLGIGSCYIGDIMENYEYHRDLFRLPDYVFPAAMLVFGYPTQQQKDRPKPPRTEEQYIVYENVYHRAEGERQQELFKTYAGNKGLREWIRVFCKRKYQSDFAVEMNRSVSEFVSKLL